jgi:hypothetical protein
MIDQSMEKSEKSLARYLSTWFYLPSDRIFLSTGSNYSADQRQQISTVPRMRL